MRPCALVLLAAAALAPSAVAQEPATLLAATAERGVVLRWSWGEGERPAGWLVERRAAGGDWTRLTTQPITRTRDRAAARAMLGDHFTRYEALLFPDDPRAERADPESFRAVQLLAADVDPGVAQVLGLRYDDAEARAGEAYEYRLIGLTSAGERVLAVSGAVEAGRYRTVSGPDSLRLAQRSAAVTLRWNVAPAWSAYHIYRGSRADGSDAARINTSPVVVFYDGAGASRNAAPVFYSDTAAPRADTTWYRVEGIDAFGRTSRRSAPAAAVWRDLTAPAAPVAIQTRVSGDTVIVTWLPPADADVVAFQVWRADTSAGPFERLGDPVHGALELRDGGRPSRRLGWYRVTAIDSAGHEGRPSALAMAEVADVTAPTAPDSLSGAAAPGRLAFQWRPIAAADLLGYRIYRASTEGGLWSMLTSEPDRDTAYGDAIPGAADHAYYYRVTAVDSAFNESAPSPVLALRPPDVTPPSAPRIRTVRGDLEALVADWFANPEADVVAWRVLFRAPGETDWTEWPETVAAATRTVRITGLGAGRRYEVSLVAIDDAGNRSEPAPAVSGESRRRPAAAPDLQRASYDRASRSVVLEWSAPDPGVAELLVLRREDAGVFRPVGQPTPGETRFADTTARPARRYEYALQARDRAGNVTTSRPRRLTIAEAR